MKPNIVHILVAIFMFMKILTFNVMSMMQAGRQQKVYGVIEDLKMCSLAFPLIRIDRSLVRHGSLRQNSGEAKTNVQPVEVVDPWDVELQRPTA